MNSKDSIPRDLVGKLNERGGYDPAYFKLLFDAEDRHFWFRARKAIIAALVRRISPSPQTILDVGCGTGTMLQILKRAYPRETIVGMDLFTEALRYARRRTGCSRVRADARFPPFSAQFDLIILLDVLEHLPDDVQVLRNLCDLLTDEGVLILTVPAHSSLWSGFDEASGHYRRYELDEIRSKLTSAGYRVAYHTQFMATVFPLAWLMRRVITPVRQRIRRNSAPACEVLAELRVPRVIDKLLFFALTQEARLIAQGRRLPIGASLLALARPQGRKHNIPRAIQLDQKT